MHLPLPPDLLPEEPHLLPDQCQLARSLRTSPFPPELRFLEQHVPVRLERRITFPATLLAHLLAAVLAQ